MASYPVTKQDTAVEVLSLKPLLSCSLPNACKACRVSSADVFGLVSLTELVLFLSGAIKISLAKSARVLYKSCALF